MQETDYRVLPNLQVELRVTYHFKYMEQEIKQELTFVMLQMLWKVLLE